VERLRRIKKAVEVNVFEKEVEKEHKNLSRTSGRDS
jgi:hypothetical protein